MKPDPAFGDRRPAVVRAVRRAQRSELAREAWGWIVGAVHARREYMVGQAMRCGLTLPQAQVLRMLGSGPSHTTTSLAKALGCDASNITGLVDRLEARSLIERTSMRSDRRVKILSVTARGNAVISRLNRTLLEPPSSLARLAKKELSWLSLLLAEAFSGAEPGGPIIRKREARRQPLTPTRHGLPSNSKSA